MKRIKTAEEIRRKENTVKFVAGGVLIFLMFFSTAGFALNGLGGGGSSESSEEGVYFDGTSWIYNFGEQQFSFKNKVEDSLGVLVPVSLKLTDFSQNILYIDSENSEAFSEIATNLGRYSSRTQEACYGACERELPEKDCSVNLVSFKESEERKVYQEGNCVFIEGDLVSVDAFLYKIIGFT